MFTPFRPFRTVLAVPGAARFSVTGVVARLPISMVGLGIVLLVEGATGSYALAGAVSATNLLSNAGSAVFLARCIDRLGQARVLVPAIVVWGVTLTALVVTVQAGAPRWTTFAAAVAAGVAMPSVGTCVRARWSALLPDAAHRGTAFALEAVLDEVVFMVGPIAVTLLATTLTPTAGLATAITVGVLGTLAFAGLRATEPAAHAVHRSGRGDGGADGDAAPRARPGLPWRLIVPLAAASLALGLLFGAAEVTTVAFAEERGHRGLSGPLLAVWAGGSLLAGVISGSVRWRRDTLARCRIGAAAMTVTMLVPPLVDGIATMAVVLFLAGFAISPTLISLVSLAEQGLPAERLTEGMAFLNTGVVAGVAPGASLAGIVIDAHGASSAYLVCLGGGVLALLGTLTARRDPVPAAGAPTAVG